MLKLVLSGCNGRMGQAVTAICEADEKIDLVAGFDLHAVKQNSYPVYANPMEFSGTAQVVVDFSNPGALSGLLQYCTRTKTPIVLCATGYSAEDEAKIKAAAEHIPVFQSGNMSLGINLLTDLVRRAAQVLGDGFDIEIVERHHSQKIDAPSGTAFMLADAARSALPYDPTYTYERQSVRTPRDKREIGISAVRGGTIVGEHDVLFAGLDEVIEIRHTAYSRNVFASGAVTAAKFLATVSTPGLYSMNHIIWK
ncbi:MAG: 4-hydroxy-tetrahydrodipicolinate reductase [Oscillospiraceae bacterium]|nr:4-hydroxy-tetrahydrodipicolinate reductase [Oscillospiraceae bacterium]